MWDMWISLVVVAPEGRRYALHGLPWRRELPILGRSRSAGQPGDEPFTPNGPGDPRMQRDGSAFAGSGFHVAIVGGGICGAAAAWDAAQRGFLVALLEGASPQRRVREVDKMDEASMEKWEAASRDCG